MGVGGGIGVDLSREERQRKATHCYNCFQEIIIIIERKMSEKGAGSNKLANNYREINLLMKTIES